MTENKGSNNEVKIPVRRYPPPPPPPPCRPPVSFILFGNRFSPIIILLFGIIALAALTFSHTVESLKDGTIKNGEESSINILDRSYC
jgi:hypothetical protein